MVSVWPGDICWGKWCSSVTHMLLQTQRVLGRTVYADRRVLGPLKGIAVRALAGVGACMVDIHMDAIPDHQTPSGNEKVNGTEYLRRYRSQPRTKADTWAKDTMGVEYRRKIQMSTWCELPLVQS